MVAGWFAFCGGFSLDVAVGRRRITFICARRGILVGAIEGERTLSFPEAEHSM